MQQNSCFYWLRSLLTCLTWTQATVSRLAEQQANGHSKWSESLNVILNISTFWSILRGYWLILNMMKRSVEQQEPWCESGVNPDPDQLMEDLLLLLSFNAEDMVSLLIRSCLCEDHMLTTPPADVPLQAPASSSSAGSKMSWKTDRWWRQTRINNWLII